MEEKIEALIGKTVEELGYELYDVIYEKEAQDYYLRIFIDTPEGISLDDCEKVNDAINPILDEANYIKDQYFLEVSSPGIEKPLKTFEQVEKSIGEYVYAKFKNPKSGLHEVEGYLKSIEDQQLEFEYLVKNIKKKIVVDYDNIQFIRLAVKF